MKKKGKDGQDGSSGESVSMKAEDLSSIPGNHKVKVENGFP